MSEINYPCAVEMRGKDLNFERWVRVETCDRLERGQDY